MSIRDWFVSRHTRYLERVIDRLQTEHAAQIDSLTKRHESELDSAREQVAWHRDEIERLRTFLIPTMKPVYDQVRDVHSDEPPPAPDPDAGLTPWERIKKRELAAQDAAIEFRKKERQEREAAANKKPAESGETPKEK